MKVGYGGVWCEYFREMWCPLFAHIIFYLAVSSPNSVYQLISENKQLPNVEQYFTNIAAM